VHTLLLALALGAAAASPSQARILLSTQETAVVALEAPAFADLPREQRLLAWWLAQAGLAGDAIAWDQQYRHNLAIARLLRGILTHPQAVQKPVLERIRQFARTVYLQHGLHDEETERKATPPFTPAELRLAALAAQAAGAQFGLPPGTRLEAHLRALEGPLFDPRVDPLRTDKAPGPGKDPLLSSAVNLYESVSLRDLRGFHERYPLASRLVKQDGQLVEQVYRIGGLYGDRLTRAEAALARAIPLAQGTQRRSLEELAGFFRTGDPNRFRLSQRAWLAEASPVDYILGFIETYADPRGLKGLWEGFVGVRDGPRSEVLEKLAARAQEFEDAMPWAPEFRRAQVKTAAAEALQVVSGSGDDRPQSFTGVNLPNEQAEREQFGSKSFLLPSYDDAIAQARELQVAREFSPPEVAEDQTRCRSEQRFALVAMHEVVGHASGRAGAKLAEQRLDPADVLAENYNTLEEARADLVAHFHAGEPRAREVGLLPGPRCQELYPQFATTSWLISLATTPEGERVEEDHLRAELLQLWWFRTRGAVTVRVASGKTYVVVTDRARWHEAAGELLALLQQIKSTGDAPTLAKLVADHGSRLDTGWRDEVVARILALGLPRRVYALPPVLRPVLTDGKMQDVIAAPVEDLDAQILEDWKDY
jgi:dipeptidyl-peptidase-3